MPNHLSFLSLALGQSGTDFDGQALEVVQCLIELEVFGRTKFRGPSFSLWFFCSSSSFFSASSPGFLSSSFLFFFLTVAQMLF
jgi:hypothetical protein